MSNSGSRPVLISLKMHPFSLVLEVTRDPTWIGLSREFFLAVSSPSTEEKWFLCGQEERKVHSKSNGTGPL